MSHFDACVIDEAHLIPQWGDSDFRDAYMQLGRLRSSFPDDCPFLAVTATASPREVQLIEKVLHFNINHLYYRNLGNNRPNICHHVQVIGSPRRYDEIKEILNRTIINGAWPRTMIFANTVKDVQSICSWLQGEFPDQERQFDTFFARRREITKRKVMRRFVNGEMSVLVTTEAAGMVSVRLLYPNRLRRNLSRERTSLTSIQSFSGSFPRLYLLGYSMRGERGELDNEQTHISWWSLRSYSSFTKLSLILVSYEYQSSVF